MEINFVSLICLILSGLSMSSKTVWFRHSSSPTQATMMNLFHFQSNGCVFRLTRLPTWLNKTAHRVLHIVILHTDRIHLNRNRVTCDSRLVTRAQLYSALLSLIVFSCFAAAHNGKKDESHGYIPPMTLVHTASIDGALVAASWHSGDVLLDHSRRILAKPTKLGLQVKNSVENSKI